MKITFTLSAWVLVKSPPAVLMVSAVSGGVCFCVKIYNADIWFKTAGM